MGKRQAREAEHNGHNSVGLPRESWAVNKVEGRREASEKGPRKRGKELEKKVPRTVSLQMLERVRKWEL